MIYVYTNSAGEIMEVERSMNDPPPETMGDFKRVYVAPQVRAAREVRYTSHALPPNWKYAMEAGCSTDERGRVQFNGIGQVLNARDRARADGVKCEWDVFDYEDKDERSKCINAQRKLG